MITSWRPGQWSFLNGIQFHGSPLKIQKSEGFGTALDFREAKRRKIASSESVVSSTGETFRLIRWNADEFFEISLQINCMGFLFLFGLVIWASDSAIDRFISFFQFSVFRVLTEHWRVQICVLLLLLLLHCYLIITRSFIARIRL